MTYLLTGILAFLFFVIYDINSVTANYKIFRGGFFIGCLLLISATGGVVSSSLKDTMWDTGTMVFIPLAIVFLFLLVYTLFFAIPFGDTYIKTETAPKTCTTGFYAMSRHPGVLWFIGFYFSLWLALSGSLLLLAGILFSLLNLIYILLQDRWIFMKTFPDYGEYKKTTPFLIPNGRSLKRCVQTFR
jgi:protein-S-isoprenylcysteine O-methyltransferase Ste14